MRSIYNIDDTTKNVENIVTSTISNTTLNGDIIGNIKSNQISAGVITDSDIAANAAISDSKLNQITTANKIANSATTATSANTANAIVARNGSGDVTLSTLHGNIDNSTLNVGTTDATTINIGTATTTQLVNIGTGSGITTINLGGAGDTINIAGTLAYINTTNLNVTDSNIVLNKGGSAGSGGASGISIEEAGTNTGYAEVNGTRDGWALKAPSTAGIATITPGASGIALNQSSHNPVTMNLPGNGFYIDPSTQIITMGVASSSTTGSLSNTDWNTFNNAANAVTSGLSGDITGPLNATQISPGVIVNADINVSAAIADTKLATLTSSGKVANSATTATAANTDGAIVLRNNTSGINIGLTNMQGNLYLQRYPTASDYRVLAMDTGNSRSYVFANYQQLGDTFNLGYNWFYDTGASTPTYYNTGQGTSRISMTSGQISLYTNSAAASAPVEYLRVASGFVSTQNGASFVGPVTGNVTGNCSGSASTFTGSLSGDITGTMGATQIAAGAITNADINASAAIVDTKLATITSSGKVANSATSATASNTDGTIVLRNNTGTTNLGHLSTGDIELNATDATYHSIRLGGGNSTGYLFGYFPTLGDGIHLTYNNAYLNSGTITIPNTGGGTSRVTCGYGSVSVCAGSAGVAPTEYLRVDSSGSVSTQNGGVFTGNLTGSVTGSSTQIKTSNGSVSTNGNASPTAANMALVSTSTSAAKWDYPLSWAYLAQFGGTYTLNTTYTQISTTWPALPAAGKYIVEVRILGFSTSTANITTMTVQQGSTNLGSYATVSWNSTGQQQLLIRFQYNFTATTGLSIYGQTNTGTSTILDHELYILKANVTP